MTVHDQANADPGEDVAVQAPGRPAADHVVASLAEQRTDVVASWLVTLAAVSSRFLVVVAALAVIVFALSQVMLVVMAVIVALLFATALSPPVAWLRARGVPRALAALALVAAVLGLFSVAIAFIGPQVTQELADVGDEVVEGFESVLEWVADSALPVNRAQIDGLIDQGFDGMRANAGEVTGGILTAFYGLLHGGAGIILSFVLLFFFLKDGDRMVDWLVARTGQRHRDALRAAGRRGWETLGGYIRGTAVVALVDAVGIGVGIWVIGLPLVLPLALLTFFGGFFPIVGATVAGFVAVLVALVTLGLPQALLTLAVVVAVQQLEGNVLQPLVLGRAVRVHPVVILLAIAGGALLGGVVGAFLAVPVAAVSAAVGNELRLRREARAGLPASD